MLFNTLYPQLHYTPSTSSYNYTIETKYYSSRVEFRCLARAEQEQLANDLAQNNDRLPDVQVFIALLNLSDPTSLSSLSSWNSWLESAQPSTLMLVAWKQQQEEERQDGQQYEAQVEEWCQDHGLEYIYVTPSSTCINSHAPLLNAELLPNSEYAEGFARIKENLELHPWSNLVMKSDTAARLNKPTDVFDFEQPTVPSRFDIDAEDDEMPIASDPIPHATANTANASAAQNGTQEHKEAIPSSHTLPDPSLHDSSPDPSDDMNAELSRQLAGLEGLDELLNQVNAIRKQARDPNVSDDERRRRAEDMVLNIFKQLGMEDELGDEEEQDQA